MEPMLLAVGTVQRVWDDNVTSSKDGKQYTFHKAIIVGPSCMAEVRFKDAGMLVEGDEVSAIVAVTVYRSRVTLEVRSVQTGASKSSR